MIELDEAQIQALSLLGEFWGLTTEEMITFSVLGLVDSCVFGITHPEASPEEVDQSGNDSDRRLVERIKAGRAVEGTK